MGIAIDTSALVALERGGGSLIDAIVLDDRSVHDRSVVDRSVYVPSIVVAELWIGVELADNATRRATRLAKIEALVAHTQMLPFTDEVAPTYAKLYAGLRRAGAMIPSNDLGIAALAVHFGHHLLVGPQDEEHFRRVEGLVVHALG